MQEQRLSLRAKFRTLHLASHLLALVGLVWLFKSKEFIWLLVAFVTYLYAGIVGVNVALHRYFAHRSFTTSRFGYWVLLVSSFLPMLGSPAAWGSIHLLHHQTSDTSLDPHCPTKVGILKSWFTVWPSAPVPLSVFRNMMADKKVMALDRNYFRFVVLYVLALTLIDWKLASFVFALPAVGCFHGAAAIAVLPHIKFLSGYRNHKSSDLSENNFFAWILSLGEGWHNNHHFAPGKYRQGEKWWELDPPAFVIKYFFLKSKV